MFKKELPIITMGLSIVAAMLVLSWAVFIKLMPAVPVQAPVVDDEEIVADDDIPDDTENDDSEIDIPDWENGNVLEADTSNWETYINEIYKYKIKYPKNWIVETYEDNHGKNAEKPINLAFHTKDKQKIENYQESLVASVNVAVINKSLDFTVEDYLKDFGYDLSSETIKDGRVLQTRGIAETWMNIKEENFKGSRAYIIQTTEEHGYYLYFEYNQSIYKIVSLYRKKEIDKQEILEIINTFKFIN